MLKDVLGKEIKEGDTALNIFLKENKINYRLANVIRVHATCIRIRYPIEGQIHYSNIYRTDNRIVIMREVLDNKILGDMAFEGSSDPISRFELMDV